MEQEALNSYTMIRVTLIALLELVLMQ